MTHRKEVAINGGHYLILAIHSPDKKLYTWELYRRNLKWEWVQVTTFTFTPLARNDSLAVRAAEDYVRMLNNRLKD